MPQYRILKSPDDGLVAGGSTDDLVTISKAELDALRALAGASPIVGGRAEPGAEDAREAAHAREIADRDRKVSEWEGAFRTALRDRELATALVDRPLVSGAAPN